jgi:XTP/dITP diphosphohydrolase
MLKDADVAIRSLEEYPHIGDTLEDADSLEGNALKKALEAHRQTGVPSIADDTGLEVGYLNNAPGVYSARYAGPNATYSDNCRKLLKNLRGVPPRRRGARFRCVIAFVQSEEQYELVHGVCRGVITEWPRGGSGFGYDPVFLPLGHTQTFGEMSRELKNAVSHRSRAIGELKTLLSRIDP